MNSDKLFISSIRHVVDSDAEGLTEARRQYGESWYARGGVGAYMMIVRKSDRIENTLKNADPQWDIMAKIKQEVRDKVQDGILDDVRDLRRYLGLLEAKLVEEGIELPEQRDNRNARLRREREGEKF